MVEYSAGSNRGRGSGETGVAPIAESIVPILIIKLLKPGSRSRGENRGVFKEERKTTTGSNAAIIRSSPPVNFAKASLTRRDYNMHYTYILRSIKQPGAIYIGSTANLKLRFNQHNDPKHKSYSKRFSPWLVETYLGFTQRDEAEKFEKYLKSSSGKAFMRKRLLSYEFKEALAKFTNGRGDQVSITK